MARRKPSFFERLTGAVPLDSYEDTYRTDRRQATPRSRSEEDPLVSLKVDSHDEVDEVYEAPQQEIIEEGELAVDVIDNPNEIIIKTMVAGVKPNELDIDISRDVVSIRGTREFERTLNESNYYQKELFWGSFSRVIELPSEIDVELARASEKHGLLTITLPKVDKNRKTKLQIKSI